MAEELPIAAYNLNGQPVLGGVLLDKYEVIDATYGLEEDGEVKQKGIGQFKSDIVYSRRETCQLELEALHGTDSTALSKGGQLASGILAMEDGTATAWNIRDASLGLTRGVQALTLDLIQQGDQL